MLDNSAQLSDTQLNWEEIRGLKQIWMRTILTMRQSFKCYQLTALKDIDSDEDVHKSNSIWWNQTADALNTFIKFSECNQLHNGTEIMKLHSWLPNKTGSCRNFLSWFIIHLTLLFSAKLRFNSDLTFLNWEPIFKL